ncbi:polyprenyl synthetase family protein [Angustibacter luteus]|uniref:Polyprenyl synthetase family protein n=1 Tax=Angustibacter luteus TaxID=658456 RepID=A0ABW1JGD3_9ACTN
MSAAPGGASSFGLPFDDPALEATVEEAMARVEASLRESVGHVDNYIATAAGHLLEAGGKRFRPLLTVLSSQAGPHAGKVLDDVVKAAVVVELTHLASLYHDDVMDEALLRRGSQSANSRWGNTVAILTGDLLFARASQVVADLGAEAVRVQAMTFEVLCSGQIRETVGPAEGQDPVEHYLTVLAEKTGVLIATSCRFGAWFGGADDATTEILRVYGERIGVAFQLADDLIDLASESGQSGKTPGTDLREGVATLPVLYAQESTDPADARLLELLAGPLTDDALHAETLGLLRAHPAMERARVTTRQWAQDARAVLEALPQGQVRTALSLLADGVVDRSA